MLKSIFVFVALFLFGCNDPANAPRHAGCVEFNHHTTREDHAVTCRMLWCEKSILDKGTNNTGGVAALWCDFDETHKVEP